MIKGIEKFQQQKYGRSVQNFFLCVELPWVRAENHGSSGAVEVKVWSVCFCRKFISNPSPASAIQPSGIQD